MIVCPVQWCVFLYLQHYRNNKTEVHLAEVNSEITCVIWTPAWGSNYRSVIPRSYGLFKIYFFKFLLSDRDPCGLLLFFMFQWEVWPLFTEQC